MFEKRIKRVLFIVTCTYRTKRSDFYRYSPIFTSLNDLERIIRCPGRFKFEEHNVATHSWKVSQYAMFFATLEEMHGATVDWKSLYEKTINHDFAEVFIGDIKTPVKHASPELKQMLAHVEEKMMEKFIINEIPQNFRLFSLNG